MIEMKNFFSKYKKQLVILSAVLFLFLLILGAAAIQNNTGIDDSDAATANLKIFLVAPASGNETLYSASLRSELEMQIKAIINGNISNNVTSETLFTTLTGTGYASIGELKKCNTKPIPSGSDCENKMNAFKESWFNTYSSKICSGSGQVIMITPSYFFPKSNFTIGSSQIDGLDHIDQPSCSVTTVVASPNMMPIKDSYAPSDYDVIKKRLLNSLVVQARIFKTAIIDKFLSSTSATSYGFPTVPNCSESSSTSIQQCLEFLKGIPDDSGTIEVTLKNGEKKQMNKNFWQYLSSPNTAKLLIDSMAQLCPSGCSGTGGGGNQGGGNQGGGDQSGTCPASTQARFVLIINGTSTGLITGNSYGLDDIDKFDYQILQNQDTSSFFAGKVVLKHNGTQIETYTGSASTRTLSDVEVGTYTLEGYKGTTLCGSGTVIIQEGSDGSDIDDGTDENGNEGTLDAATCQARFSVKLKNKETREPLTQNGTYQISRIENISWVVVKNMQTDPPLYHKKKVTLKTPSDNKAQEFTGGEPRFVETIEEGKYVLKAFKGDKLCSKAKLFVTEDTSVSKCEKFNPIAGFYRNSSGSTFVKDGTFTNRSEFKYAAVIPDANGNVSDIPSTDSKQYFKGKILLKVDGQVVNEHIRQRAEPTSLPSVNGNQYTVEVYDANTDELCSSATISFGSSAISGETECGVLDIDGNEVADVHDLANFARKYNKSCTDKATDYLGIVCGAKDTNIDGKVDIIDLGRFGQLYQQLSCSANTLVE